MNDTTRSVAVGAAFALGGLVVAGIALCVVRARRGRQPGEVPAHPQAGAPAAGDGSEVPGAMDSNPAGLPADIRPDDPSYGPVI